MVSIGSTERDEAASLAVRAPGLLARLQLPTAAVAVAASGRDVAGVLVEPQALLEVDKTFMLAVAQQAAVSLERARLYDAEQRARHDAEAARGQAEKIRDRLSFLWEVSAILAKRLDHRESLVELGALA